jgi:hypothetical protein
MLDVCVIDVFMITRIHVCRTGISKRAMTSVTSQVGFTNVSGPVWKRLGLGLHLLGFHYW